MDAGTGFDFSNPAFRADPYPAYRFLREAAPMWRAPTGQWVVSTHAGCSALLRDPQMGRCDHTLLANEEAMGEPAVASLTRMMLFLDPPSHTRIRRLVSHAFNARRIEALRPRIEAIVDALIDRVAGQGGMDVIADFAHRLPVTVICDMLGVPEADRGPFLDESTVRGRILDPTPLSREEMDEANASFGASEAYFRHLLAYRRENPGEDLVSGLLAAGDADESLSEAEIVANINLLFGAGHETTTNLIGNGLLALHRNPDQLARLLADPAMIPNAVEELLRYDSPVQLTSRYALADTTIMGETVEQGQEVIALLGAANRDPAAYAGDPEALDVGRPGVRAISFGGGLHFCLGAQLARIEGEIALRRLIARLPAMRLAEPRDVAWKQTVTLRGLASLPATW
jgi:cytochrome P450